MCISDRSCTVLRGGRSFGIARHWHPVLKTYMIPFITSRSSTWRLLPPRLAGGINGSISAHSSSVRSLGYRNALRSYRPRFFDVHIGDPPRIRPPLLNHKQLTGFNMFSDRHLGDQRARLARINLSTSECFRGPVSYTHLTLPTSDLV